MTNKKIICQMSRLTKKYKNTTVLSNINLGYYYGAKIGILGLNGAGKSTILRIMAGIDKEFEGDFSVSEGYSIGFLPQEPVLDEKKTVIEAVSEAVADVKKLLKDFEDVSNKLGQNNSEAELNKLLEKQSNLMEQLDLKNAWDLDSRLEMALSTLRCPDNDRVIESLSGGEKRRVALCRLLLLKPDILLLDEPTNHLDAETIAWLEHHLHEYEGTVIAVTHDRYFLDNVATWILEIDRTQGIPFEGNYSGWLKYKQKRLQDEEKQQSARQKTLARELEWVSMSAQGRHAKSKARITAYEKLLSEESNKSDNEQEIFIPVGPRLGDKVLVVKNLSKSFQDKILFDNVSFSLPAGGIIGVVGPNGTGKSSLFKIITGEIKASQGDVEFGSSVKMVYGDQARSSLNEEDTVWQAISGGQEQLKFGNKTIQSRAYVAKFNFPGTAQQMLIKELSGGARNRVYLANTLKQEANLILLDEPTNDLDINTLRALEEALQNFAGSAFVISHDRWFLDRVATHILAFEGQSKVTFFDGNYSEYEQDLLKRLGTTSLIPARIKYRQLTR